MAEPMSEDICVCHTCGRNHRPLGAGVPPWRKREVELMAFYGVETVPLLLDEMAAHIAKLQARLPKSDQTMAPRRVREG